jgi:pyruvate ferredoxin oxidoreductase gamma subunit
MLAQIALAAGKNAQTMPFFGVERRGANVKTSVRLADEPIKIRSQSTEPDVLVVMHANLLEAAIADGEHKQAYFVVSSPEPLETAQKCWYFDGSSIALENGLVVDGEPYVNIPMLGALCKVLDLPKDLMVEQISKKWPDKRGLPNVIAATKAYDTVTI